MFGKKKQSNVLKIMHYEGLPNFNQDFPCLLKNDGTNLIFESQAGNKINLPIDKINLIERMPELNFMGKYHDNALTTSKLGVKWFTIIHYQSSNESNKYIALWTVDLKSAKFFDEIKSSISIQEITL